ncbi:hypothetical protein RIF23_05235 [Lipingzhangella sp. LS1_29]|uniref:Helix-turn-helix DNA binding domain protein n=1 Tax=Lipingzhangella rawalii TaxID=2055835 RepID=A0ABU2H315_9ACTN|nr:hypothetical protein [Lipingzhangella rawalii]MDS1269693.1 hypothetical protein [Lipingzhangella rawalii]
MSGAPCQACERATGDNATVCPACVQRLSQDLEQVYGVDTAPGLAAELDTAVAKQARMGRNRTERTARGTTPALPVDLGASEAAAVLRNTLSSWCQAVHQDRGGSLPKHRLSTMARWLRSHMAWLRRASYGGQATDEICAAVEQARRQVDLPEEQALAAVCTCGERVYAPRGQASAVCRACGESWSTEEQRAQLRGLAAEVLATAADLARITSRPERPVTAAMVRGWAHRGRLSARGSSGGAPLYRVGDALDLLDAKSSA